VKTEKGMAEQALTRPNTSLACSLDFFISNRQDCHVRG
jgi:hypothetical protein